MATNTGTEYREERKHGPDQTHVASRHDENQSPRWDDRLVRARHRRTSATRDQAAAWMTNDEANHRIGFLAVPGLGNDAEKVRHNGMHHCAFEYGPRRKFRRTAKRQFFGLAARRKERPNGR